jgi:hypothetical protein
MKTLRPTRLAVAASCLAALLFVGCSRTQTAVPAASVSQAEPAPAPTVIVVPAPAPVAPPAVAPVNTPAVLIGPASAIAPDTGSSTWADMENLTFDQRAAFTADLTDLVRKLDGQISALNAKRSTMTTNTGDWDFAMKEVNAARSYLVSLETEVATATPDTWGEEKDRVGGAWRRAQDACDKVRMSTTS